MGAGPTSPLLAAWVPRALLPLGACAASMALRLHRLGAESLWYDETVSAYLADLPIGAMIAHTSRDIHPPGYYLLLHLWAALAGKGEFALAFLSLAAGVLLVALIHRLTRRLAGLRTANLAAGIGAFSTYSIWYSQEVRMYTIAALLMLALFAVTLLLREGPARVGGWWAVWAALSALSLYTIYYSLFLLPLLSLSWLLAALRESAGRRQALNTWLAGQVGSVLLYLPWLPIAIRQALDPPVPPWRSAMPWFESLTQGGTALAFGESAPAGWWPVALALILCACLPLLRSGARHATRWAVAAFLAPWALMLLASLLQPLFHPRYLFPFAAFFSVSLALGLARLASTPVGRWIALALAALYLSGNLWSAQRMWTLPEYRADDLRGAVTRLADRWLPGDVVLFQAGYTYTALEHYWPGEVAWRGRAPDYAGAAADTGPVVLMGGSLASDANLGWGDPRSDFYRTTRSATTDGITRALVANRRLWLFRLYDTVTDPGGEVRDWLARSLVPLSDEPISGPSYGRLQSYIPVGDAADCPSPVDWGERVRTCVEVGEPAGLSRPDRVPVYLSVAGLAADPRESVHYTLRLQASDGETVVQSDGALILHDGDEPGEHYVLNPLSLPLGPGSEGVYPVVLGLYVFREGVPVPLAPVDAVGSELAGPDGLLVLGEVSVP